MFTFVHARQRWQTISAISTFIVPATTVVKLTVYTAGLDTSGTKDGDAGLIVS